MTAPERQAHRRAGGRTRPAVRLQIRTAPPGLLLVSGDPGGERTGADLIAQARAARREAADRAADTADRG
ncbi:hypothetical protein ABIE45_004029 [Methylobacterium sp. OAE515]|uniref:hypothetical protein n=1 Tax=Methylobacterium sp. OAE515 TaxID=2817895 RepID=UPI00178A5F6B